MGLFKFLLWAGERTLGPVGDVLGGTIALLSDDKSLNEPAQLVARTERRLRDLHAELEKKDLRKVEDYKERGRRALQRTRANRSATLDYLAACEARHLERGDLAAVESTRSMREDFLRTYTEAIEGVRRSYRENTGEDLEE
jgi:hypothetical protein